MTVCLLEWDRDLQCMSKSAQELKTELQCVYTKCEMHHSEHILVLHSPNSHLHYSWVHGHQVATGADLGDVWD